MGEADGNFLAVSKNVQSLVGLVKQYGRGPSHYPVADSFSPIHCRRGPCLLIPFSREKQNGTAKNTFRTGRAPIKVQARQRAEETSATILLTPADCRRNNLNYPLVHFCRHDLRERIYRRRHWSTPCSEARRIRPDDWFCEILSPPSLDSLSAEPSCRDLGWMRHFAFGPYHSPLQGPARTRVL